LSILGIGGVYEGFEKIAEVNIVVNSQSITFEDLNGDQDIVYLIVACFKNNTGSDAFYNFYPNNVTTGLEEQLIYADGTSIAAVRATRNALLITPAGYQVFGVVWFFAKSNVVRRFFSQTSRKDAVELEYHASRWSNTIDNVTSLVINSGLASGSGVGSKCILYRKKG